MNSNINNAPVNRTKEGQELYDKLTDKEKKILNEIRSKLLLIQRYN